MTILETRQIDDFTDYAISKTHVQIYYPPISEDEGKHVWNALLAKFEAQGVGFSQGAREFISSPNMRKRKWTGDEMRRILESAAAVARPADGPEEGEEEEQTRTFVDVLDLEDVVELSEGFRQEVATTQGSDEKHSQLGAAGSS
ncbi:hypothetical protein PG996_007662 [Apiospora saccharicola]|uniref:AAA+ ATPase lid domain-containing protein n=1 Tax=Apiospora saccharicola TaxID=335842 RepID=A0ABR1VBH7_9PEZI